MDDGVTTASTITSTEPINIASTGNEIGIVEGTAPSGVASSDLLWADSTAHRLKMNNNNGGAITIASTTDLLSYLPLTGGTLSGNLTLPCTVYTGSSSGSVTVCAQAAAGTPTVQWPTTSGQVALTTAEVVTYSATPTFTPGDSLSGIVLTGNITSFTMGATASGTSHTLCFVQGSGSYTVAGPANVHGLGTIGTTSGKYNCQSFIYYAAASIWVANGPMQINE
jgi:hypothetical protein